MRRAPTRRPTCSPSRATSPGARPAPPSPFWHRNPHMALVKAPAPHPIHKAKHFCGRIDAATHLYLPPSNSWSNSPAFCIHHDRHSGHTGYLRNSFCPVSRPPPSHPAVQLAGGGGSGLGRGPEKANLDDRLLQNIQDSAPAAARWGGAPSFPPPHLREAEASAGTPPADYSTPTPHILSFPDDWLGDVGVAQTRPPSSD